MHWGLVHIVYLADRPELTPALAEWHYNEWSHLRPGDSIQTRIRRLSKWHHREQIPTAFVAVEESQLLGSACLITHDMHTRMDLSPWLAGVFVVPEHRQQGSGVSFVQRVVEEAESLHVKTLYLYTPSAVERFYARLGWWIVNRTVYRNEDVVVMGKDIADA